MVAEGGGHHAGAHHDPRGALAEGWRVGDATDCLYALLSVRRWEVLTQECGWSQRQYVRRMQVVARRALAGGGRAGANG